MTPMNPSMIQICKLSKRYSGRAVVDQVSLQINKGCIFGLLGPNAAGKTTLIRMLCGVIKQDTGNILIKGMDVSDAKPIFGYVAQHFGQYEELSVWKNLEFYAHMYKVNDKQRLKRVLSRYALDSLKHQLAGTLSGGYQRRLALACALSHDPDVLFLDEPTAGIDPVTRKSLWDDFYSLSAEGKTLFITTHYMEEAQRCHQLAFMSEGKIVASGTPEDIKSALQEASVYTARVSYHPTLHMILKNMNEVLLLNQFGDELRIVVKSKTQTSILENSISKVTGQSIPLYKTEPNIEDVFIALTQANVTI